MVLALALGLVRALVTRVEEEDDAANQDRLLARVVQALAPAELLGEMRKRNEEKEKKKSRD